METLDHVEPKAPSLKITELANKAASQEAESVGFMNPGTKVKKKTGRPPGSKTKTKEGETIGKVESQKPESAAPVIPTQKIVGPIVNLISKTTATMLQEPAAVMNANEFNDISESLGMVLEKWMPTISDKYGAELYCAVSLSSWGARLWAIKTLKDEEKEKKQKEAQKNMDLMKESSLPETRSQNFDIPQENNSNDFLKNIGFNKNAN